VEVKRAEPRDSKSQTPGPAGASQWGSRIMPSAANGWAGQPPPTWQQGYGPQGTASVSASQSQALCLCSLLVTWFYWQMTAFAGLAMLSLCWVTESGTKIPRIGPAQVC